jgi:hypothetical protein
VNRACPEVLRQRKQHFLLAVKVVINRTYRDIRLRGKPSDIDRVYTFFALDADCAVNELFSELRVFLSQKISPRFH